MAYCQTKLLKNSQEASNGATWMPAMIFSPDAVKNHLQSQHYQSYRKTSYDITKNVSYMSVKGLICIKFSNINIWHKFMHYTLYILVHIIKNRNSTILKLRSTCTHKAHYPVNVTLSLTIYISNGIKINTLI